MFHGSSKWRCAIDKNYNCGILKLLDNALCKNTSAEPQDSRKGVLLVLIFFMLYLFAVELGASAGGPADCIIKLVSGVQLPLAPPLK
mgnify:CR=1 FL=1